jgi:hypothetical protein
MLSYHGRRVGGAEAAVLARVICPNCSNAYSPPLGGPERCPRCGYVQGQTAPTPAAAYVPAAGAAGAFTLAPPVAEPATAPVQLQTTNGLSIASMVLGICAIPLFFIGFILAPLALIFGFIGYNQARKRGQRGAGMAVTGIVLGSLYILGALFFFFTSYSIFGRY